MVSHFVCSVCLPCERVLERVLCPIAPPLPPEHDDAADGSSGFSSAGTGAGASGDWGDGDDDSTGAGGGAGAGAGGPERRKQRRQVPPPSLVLFITCFLWVKKRAPHR